MAKRRAECANAEGPVSLGHRADKEENLYALPVLRRHGRDIRRALGQGQERAGKPSREHGGNLGGEGAPFERFFDQLGVFFDLPGFHQSVSRIA